MITRVSTWAITVLTVNDVKATYHEDCMGAGRGGQGGQAPTLEKIRVGNDHSGNTNHNRELEIAH